MDRHESEQWISEHTAGTGQVANGSLPHHDGGQPTEHSLAEKPTGLYEEVHEEIEQLRLEVERLRERQQALRQTPQSDGTDLGNDADDEHSDNAHPQDPADRAGVFQRRPVRLILALLIAAVLCAGGLRFWNYLQSYEWTDDAEVDGHLDPISTRIDGTSRLPPSALHAQR